MGTVDEEPRPDDEGPRARGAGRILKRAARSRIETARTIGTLGTVGLSFVLAIVLGTALGLWIDRLTGWSPVFFLTGFVLGLAAGILNVYRAMSNLPK